MSLMDELPAEVAEAIRADGRDAGEFLLDLVRSRPPVSPHPKAGAEIPRKLPPVVPDDEDVMEELSFVPLSHPVVGTMTVTFGPVRPHLPPRVPDEE